MKGVPVLLLLLSAFTLGQTDPAQGSSASRELTNFLAPLEEHPALRAAAANVRAAQLQLGGAYEPFALSVTAGVSAFQNDDLDLAPEVPGRQGLPVTGAQFGVELTLKPFPLPELVDQRQIALEQAKLAYRETLSGLEANALEAGLGAQLAEISLATARQGAELARRALEATRLRTARGAATERELREAETLRLEAESLVLDAEGRAALARQALEQLLPDGPTLEVAALRFVLPSGLPLAVAQAELNAALAELSRDVTAKALLPVVQAGYTWNVDDRNSLGLLLESRTLQPRLSYAYQDPARSPPQTAVNGSFQVGVALTFSAANLAAADAAQAQAEGARAGLEAARAGALVQRQALEHDLDAAQRALELAQRRLEDAQATLQETGRREGLGLSIPLDTQRAALERQQALLALHQAHQTLLSRVLDIYGFYALPLTPSFWEVAR